MTLKPRRPLPRMSSKKLSEVGPQWSTITTKGKKPRRKKQRTAAQERAKVEREYGGEARIKFVAGLNCAACGAEASERRPSQNAHLRNGGMSRKADAHLIAPLCAKCHHVQHADGWAILEIEFGFDREEAAAQCEAAWQAHINRGN